MWWLLSVILGLIIPFSIILSISVVFDVGGRDSGLAYSLSLFHYYLAYSTIRVIAIKKSRLGSLVSIFFRLGQWIAIPTLMIWALGQSTTDTSSSNRVERSCASNFHSDSASWTQWVFGKDCWLQTIMLGTWSSALRYSGPGFQLLEGFCTLLVIQASGQITRWLINRGRSDTWMIILLAFSGSIIASAVYFLWRVAQFPQICNLDATLIGATMTTAIFLCAYGIISGRGGPIEGSLLFAYVVLCVYQIFTDYFPTDNSTQMEEPILTQSEIPPLPPIIMASYSTLLHIAGSFPAAIDSSLALLCAAFRTITPSVFTSLAYRFFVFYSATRIIPSVRDLSAKALMQDNHIEEVETATKLLGFLSCFSPSILIAVYTSLLLQHFTTSHDPNDWTFRGSDMGGSLWRWINVGLTMILYGFELHLSTDHGRWKVH